MSSLIAKPYSKLDQEQVDTKYSEDIYDGKTGPESVETSDTPSEPVKGNSKGNWEKRYKDLQSFHDKEVATLKQQLQQSSEETFTPPTTPEEMSAFKEKHRDVYNVMLTLAHEQANTASGRVDKKVNDLSQTAQKTAAQQAKEAVMKAHPDFTEVVNSDDFHGWAADQVIEIQNWVYKNPDNPALAIKALNLFKAETGYKNEAKPPKAEKASDPRESIKTPRSPEMKGGERTWKASEIKKLSPAQYEKYEADIDAALSEGRIDFTK